MSEINSTTAGGAITDDGVWDMLYQIENNKGVKAGGFSVVMSPKQWNELRQSADSAGQPKYTSGAAPAIDRTFAGMPVYTTHNLGSGTVVVGFFSQLLIVRGGGLSFAASEHASDGTNHAFVQNQTWLRATMDVDVIVKQPKSFCKDTSFT